MQIYNLTCLNCVTGTETRDSVCVKHSGCPSLIANSNISCWKADSSTLILLLDFCDNVTYENCANHLCTITGSVFYFLGLHFKFSLTYIAANFRGSEFRKYWLTTALYPWCKNNTNLSIGVASNPMNICVRKMIDLHGPTTNFMRLHLKSIFAMCKLLVLHR